MGNINKIIKYGLESEAQSLLDSGLSRAKIAETLRNNHPEIVDLKDLSAMSVQRWIDSKERAKLEESIEQGKDPLDDFMKEYRRAIKDLNLKAERLYNKANKLLDKAELEGDTTTSLRAIKEVRDSLDQLRKNWVSLMQYGTRQTSNIYHINLKKEQNVKIMLLEFSKVLCNECRSKVSELLKEKGGN